jgi:hypothetical protein
MQQSKIMHTSAMETVWKLHGNCMETVWKLYGNCMETAWKLYGNCMETVWKLRKLQVAKVSWTHLDLARNLAYSVSWQDHCADSTIFRWEEAK